MLRPKSRPQETLPMSHDKEKSLNAARSFGATYVDRLVTTLKDLDLDEVARVAEIFLEARSRGNVIFFLGNGGSAATASHFANDLCVCASPEGHAPFRSLSLTANTAHVTCLGNDVGYENIFSFQLRNLMKPGDVVVGISASGNSPNVLNALRHARDHGGVPVAIVGFDGGKARDLADFAILVRTNVGEYGPVEDVHVVIDHLISNYLAGIRG
jgi:D-sedoheptulose 7-phosphate isomerase